LEITAKVIELSGRGARRTLPEARARSLIWIRVVQSYGLLLAFPVRPLGVLFGNRWHTRHAAVAPFPTQPTQKPRFRNSVSSRSVFARGGSRDTATLEGWIRCVFAATLTQPARQPEAVATRFKAQCNSRDVFTALTASSRQRCSRPRSLSALGSS